jgi:hypothetical protein
LDKRKGKPPVPAKTASGCIRFDAFRALSTAHKCPIHGKGYNHQLGECHILLSELDKRGYKVTCKDGKPNLPHANRATGKEKPTPATTPDELPVLGIVAAGKMTRSTFADVAARPASAKAATFSSVTTGTTADLDALDYIDLDFGCSFQAETGPNNTRTDPTIYLAPPRTPLEPPSAWITVNL